MADSDEEYDRKKRDKFRRERSDYSSERRRSDQERRPSWRDEYNEARKRSREGDSERDRKYGGNSSPPPRRGDWSPPGSKRFRRSGWEGISMVRSYGMMDQRPPWMMSPDIPSHANHMTSRSLPGEMLMGYSPGLHGDSRQRGNAFLTFKQFLAQQDDGIDDTEAVRLYQEYKTDFKKKQLHQFFNDHKEEEWFLSKYHPKHIQLNLEKSSSNLKTRLKVFNDLYNGGAMNEVCLVQDEGDAIIKLMDTAVILMEGGTERDLMVFNDEEEMMTSTDEKREEMRRDEDDDKEELDDGKRGNKRERDGDGDDVIISSKRIMEDDDVTSQEVEDVQIDTIQTETDTAQAETDTSQTETDTAQAETDTTQTETDTAQAETDTSQTEADTAQVETDTSQTETDTAQAETDTTQTEIDTAQAETDTTQTETDTAQAETDTTQTETDTAQAETDTIQIETNTAQDGIKQTSNVPDTKPHPFHLTKAVYIRHISPHVSAADILEVCKTIPGFLRMSLAEPQPERGYERRGWVTFSHDTNIKDVCGRIGSQKIKNCQLSCQINRDLSRRAKVANGVTWGSAAVESDISLLVKLVKYLDSKSKLWTCDMNHDNDNDGHDGGNNSISDVNPILGMGELCLVELSSGNGKMFQEDMEDEEGMIDDPGTAIMKRNSSIIKTLDHLIWYLRLVHSLDYYNCALFADEDNMPHRCGIITTRPHPPTAVTNEEVTEYNQLMEGKVGALMKEKVELNDEELEILGKRDHESEVEKFIEVNTQKLGENKYLCPLSGKKFRGPEFVRKHILNKHSGAVDEVRSETDFFNNYLRDPERPVPLESAAILPMGGGEMGGDKRPRRWLPPDAPDQGGGGFSDDRRMRRGYFRGRGGDRRGRRPVRHYNDLDMPDDMY